MVHTGGPPQRDRASVRVRMFVLDEEVQEAPLTMENNEQTPEQMLTPEHIAWDHECRVSRCNDGPCLDKRGKLEAIIRAAEARGFRRGMGKAAEIAYAYLSAYPIDVFIEPPPGQHGQTVDACSARSARHTARCIGEDILGWTDVEG